MQVEFYKILVYKQRRAKSSGWDFLFPGSFQGQVSFCSELPFLQPRQKPSLDPDHPGFLFPTQPWGRRQACRPGASLPLGEALSHGLKHNLILRG